MKFKTSGVIAILLLLLTTSVSGTVADWRFAAYDRVDVLFASFDQKEAKLLIQYEPRLAEYYAVFGPFQDADRKMRRYIFLKKLKQNPESINWTSVWDWSRGWDIGTKEQEKLLAEDPTYRALHDDFLTKKEAWKKAKDLTKLRNTEYEKHADIFHGLEENLLAELKKLQAEVDRRMSNTPLQPSR